MIPLLFFVDSVCFLVTLCIFTIIQVSELFGLVHYFCKLWGQCPPVFRSLTVNNWYFPLCLELDCGVWAHHFLEGNIVSFVWRIWSIPEMLSQSFLAWKSFFLCCKQTPFWNHWRFVYLVMLIAALFTIFIMAWHQGESYHSWEVRHNWHDFWLRLGWNFCIHNLLNLELQVIIDRVALCWFRSISLPSYVLTCCE